MTSVLHFNSSRPIIIPVTLNKRLPRGKCMLEQFQKTPSDYHQKKLYEKESAHGNLSIYQTSPFGMMLILNGQIIISEQDGFFYHEMMAHPALFTHHHPQKIAIVGNYFGILEEVLKHPAVLEIICITDNNPLEEAVSE